jgi:hypothetical protein
MRQVLFASLFLATISSPTRAQSQLREYRPEAIITLPRVSGFGVTLLLDERLAMGDLAPNEVILGLGLVSPQFYHRTSVAMEVRQVRTLNGPLEHRYIPTLYTNIPLPAGFELRNRTRFEVRGVNHAWSQRYINRFTLGHDVTAGDRTAFPYVQFDGAYDKRSDMITRRDASVGVRVPLSRDASIDPFVTRTSDASRAPLLGLTAGAVLRVAL